MLRLWRATINSRNGLIFAARSEQAIREELIALVIAIPLAWLVGTTVMRCVELFGAVVLVLVVELLNTAIEKLSDRLTTDHDPQIGRVKDMGSAAVGIMLLMSALFWLFAIAERSSPCGREMSGQTGSSPAVCSPRLGRQSQTRLSS